MVRCFYIMILLFFVISCKFEGFTKVGSLNYDDIEIIIYQEKDFDHTVALCYSIFREDKKVVDTTFFIGTSTFKEKIESFKIDKCGDFIYVNYLKEDKYNIIYDIRNNKSYPNTDIDGGIEIKERFMKDLKKCKTKYSITKP